MPLWTAADIPLQVGRTFVVTGTGGLGFECALALAQAGASVILAGRNPSRGAAAVQRIRQGMAAADIRFERLDLASLASILAFGQRLRQTERRLDGLIHNAAIMAPPKRSETGDGFELQIGTNFLGPFALTAELLPLLRDGRAPRVVTVSSIAARQAVIDLDDLQSRRDHQPMRAYGQSKLACLAFAFELQRRSQASGWGIESVAAHPGVSRTDLLLNGAGRWSLPGLARRGLWFLFQPAAHGAWPALFAATSPEVQGGTYWGPDRFSELRGHPTLARVPPQAMDEAMAARLWEAAERLTGRRLAARGGAR